ncbi:hypothetical protein RB6462 [Rhodopirellula baltica SH 1]|uniref:Uncharacterized protein n=1 Tax=Rhodopirellula baltica (strain DSM 10527 / NCIMB 13988 / SH1) TaxID=243090 RepID=Q7UQ88_RHOBA|nr:hypothetical protein RB6462 [Rhodopirellula baltica SH 1]
MGFAKWTSNDCVSVVPELWGRLADGRLHLPQKNVPFLCWYASGEPLKLRQSKQCLAKPIREAASHDAARPVGRLISVPLTFLIECSCESK